MATFIVQKILLDELGLNYICATYDRFVAVRDCSHTYIANDVQFWLSCFFSPVCCSGLHLLMMPPLPYFLLVGIRIQVSTVLSTMCQSLMEQPSVRLLKHIIRCYLRLCDNPRAREVCNARDAKVHTRSQTGT